MELELAPIGILHSPFKEKFGIPRQAGLLKSCSAEIELYPPYCDRNAVRGLEDFSDIWIIFAFHQNADAEWRPMIRPPRLGGNKKVGVFASRSPFRPNNLGLSRVELREIIDHQGKVRLRIACPDIVDGTPIFDIKPYVHYADANADARCGFAPDAPPKKLNVVFSAAASDTLKSLDKRNYPQLQNTIREVLELDPRPAYKKTEESRYGFKLYDLDIIWTFNTDTANVLEILNAKSG